MTRAGSMGAPGTAGAAEPLWLVGGDVVDVVGGSVRRGVNVELHDGLIRTLTGEPAPEGAETLDATGLLIAPGLVSVHAHLSIEYPFGPDERIEPPGAAALRAAARALDALRAGVTTVRTLGEAERADLVVRAARAGGWLEAPRIVAGGRAVSITGGHGQGFAAVTADGHDGFLRAARTELAAGADHVKVFLTGGIAHPGERVDGAQMTIDEMRAVVRAADERGAPVVAHAGGGPAIREALSAGIRSFEHGYLLDDETAERLAEASAHLAPTLSVTSSPEWMRDHGFTPAQIEAALAMHPEHLASARRAILRAVDPHDLDGPGVRLVAGTDYPPGEPHDGTSCAVREMELLEEAGLPPADALRAGTWEAARLLRGEDRYGSVTVGHAADLVLLSEDPTVSVSALRTITTVLQGGRIVRDGPLPPLDR